MLFRIVVTLLGLALSSPAVIAATRAGAAANNPYGIMLMSGGDAHTAGMLHHMKLAREFCGEWGYVRIGAAAGEDDVGALVRTIVGCRALHLIPVLTAMRLGPEFYDPSNRDIPKRDADGSLTSFCAAYEKWMRKVYAQGVTVPYFEYGNEVNGGYYAQHPEVYAEMCIAAIKGLKRVDPKMSFGTAGMAGCALDFYDAMLTKVPALKDHVDHWGLHPYGVNHPPGYARVFDNYALDGHADLARLLKKHGVANPVLIATETGYELGNAGDRRFPRITEDLRARYLVEAYQKYWVDDPSVRAIMPFMLQDVRWQGWNGWDFVREDYSLTPMYQAIRDLPKPKGSDYLPSGPCEVRGAISETSLSRGIEGCLVWVRRAGGPCYAAVTGSDGSYRIAGIPAGRYTISGFCDGFAGAAAQTIEVTPAKAGRWDARVPRTSYLAALDSAPGATVAPGWTPISSDAVYAVDPDVRRGGTGSQRITANGSPQGIWQVSAYESVLPGHTYSAEVWVRTRGLAPGGAAGLTLQLTDSFARVLATAEVSLGAEAAGDWKPLTLALAAVPTARRLKVGLNVDAASGEVWFDDVYLHDAAWPLPSAASAPPGGGAISGFVWGPERARLLAGATVCTQPLGRHAITDDLGRYAISGLPPGEYRVLAFHPDFDPGELRGVRPGEKGRDLVLAESPAPAELIAPGFEDVPKISSWFLWWNKFGTTEGVNSAGWHKGLPEHPDGFQPHSGKGFYGAVAGSNVKDGGVYQTIAVEPDALYEVSVWSYTYQTSDGIRGDVANRLGVDPMGGRDHASPYVIWTPLRPSHRKWTRVSLRVRPVRPKMTVFLHHQQVLGLVFNCNLFDDVEVRKIGPPDRADTGE